MIVQSSLGGVGQLLGLTIERDLKQLDVVSDLRRVEDRLAVNRPDGDIAAAAVVIGDIQKLDHAPVATSVCQLRQPGSVSPNNVWMAVVMFSGNEQQPLPVGRPGRSEDKRMTCLNMHATRAISVGQIDLIVLVIRDPRTIWRTAESVREAFGVLRQIGLIAAIAIHAKRL